MDYEKAYKEALERAKELIAKWTGKNKDFYVEDYAYIFPELRESEDEKIRKEAISIVQSYMNICDKEGDPCLSGYKVLTWLEKPKEQIPYTDFVIKPHKGDDNNPYDMRISEAQEYAIKRGFGIPFNDDEVYVDERHLTQTIGNILRWADEHPKEQKPELVQQPTITYTYNSNASRDARLKAALLALLNSDLLKVKEGGYFTKQDLIEWVERIPTDRPAWSEEDEKNLELVTDCVYEFYPDPVMKYKLKDWLKNLRPGWKPTEEQIDALAYAIQLLDDGLSPKAAKAGEELESLREQLKKL